MIQRVKGLIVHHWAAVLLAGFIGVLVVLPTALSITQLSPGTFQGIYPLRNDDEEHYLTMIREVVDGNWTMGNPYLADHKDAPYIQPYVADIYYALPTFMLGLSVPADALLNDFILPLLSVLLLYGLLFRMTGSRGISLAATAIYFLVFIYQFNRPVNPQVSFPLLLIGMHLLWSIISETGSVSRSLVQNMLFALPIGILVYIYPFYWMTLLVLYSFFTLARFSLERRYKYWFLSWLSFASTVLVLALPFVLHSIALAQDPLFSETVARNGYVHTRIPGGFLSVAPLFILAPLCIVWAWRQRIWDWATAKDVYLVAGLIGGGVVLHWQNVFTGLSLQFTSHLFIVSALFVTVIASVGAARFPRSSSRGRQAIAALATVSAIAWIVYLQVPLIRTAVSDVRHPQDISAVQENATIFAWLEANAAPDGTVLTFGGDIDKYLTVYTDQNIYFGKHAAIFLVSDAELESRWAVKHFFDSVTFDDVYGNREIWLDKYIDAYQSKEVRRKILQRLTGTQYAPAVLMDDESADRVVALHDRYVREGFRQALSLHPVNYILIDTTDTQFASLGKKFEQYPFLRFEAEINEVRIYTVLENS